MIEPTEDASHADHSASTSTQALPPVLAPLAPVATDNAFALYSCRVGDFKKFYEQLRANPLLISARDAEGHSALHWFALNNNKEAVKKLLSLGAEVDARAANLQTPLMWAAIRGHIELCLLLLENGANHDARDSLGATPLILSVQHSQPLMFLFLLNRGCKVDVGDIRGATVVHWTAYKGEMEIARILYRHGVDMQAFDGEGMNALHRACRGGQAWFADYLIRDHDFDVEVRSKDLPGRKGQTGAEMAAELGHDDVVQVCMRHQMQKRGKTTAILPVRLWRRFLYDFVMNSNVSALHLMPAMWILGYFFTVVVYFTSVLPLTGHYTTGTMFMFFLLISVAIVYYRLYSGDPGFQDPHGVLKLLHGPQVSKSVRALYGVMSGDKDIESGLAHDGRKATASVKLGTTEDVVAALVDGTVDIADPQERNHAICFSCEYVKPARVKHCPYCDRCVDRLDHHCNWVGKCVGRQNHRLFMVWTLLQIVGGALMLFFMYIVMAHIASHSSSVGHFISLCLFQHAGLSFMMFINFLSFLLGVFIFKTQYSHIAMNLTVNEAMHADRYQYLWDFQVVQGTPQKVFSNPFDQGSSWENILEFLGFRQPRNVSITTLRQRSSRVTEAIRQHGVEVRSRLLEQFRLAKDANEEMPLISAESALGGMSEEQRAEQMARLLRMQQAAAGGGGHGHSHGGQPCHGHGGGAGGVALGGGGGGVGGHGHSHGN